MARKRTPERQGSRIQGVYWMLTIPHQDFTPYLPPNCVYIKGQLERGNGETNYLHWQILIILHRTKKCTKFGIRKIFGPFHCELTYSESAEEYVWKEDTRIEGTQFVLGNKPMHRNEKTDWNEVWENAVSGKIMDIPPDVRIRCYHTLRKIETDFATPIAMQRTCYVFWGPTGTGKSRRAWEEAGLDAYIKNPRTKWWDSYRGQKHVIIDEFRGTIDIGYLLLWTDRYPVTMENKGSHLCLQATTFWITSNLPPEKWYPDVDQETMNALMRRLTVTHFHAPLTSPI
ncbi:replication-associated protein [Ninurtavirus muliumi]|uniref:Replication-associated protein n=1 Tax=Blackfly DNA Virus 15 TaxID=2586178 RepID=A0A4Y5QNC0_9VIRU|nr:replication-associated protein [Blackfly DNA Virus 15]